MNPLIGVGIALCMFMGISGNYAEEALHAEPAVIKPIPFFIEESVAPDYRYIDSYMGLFDQKEDEKPVAEIGPQKVRVIKEDGDWLLIDTWMGAKWIHLGYIRSSVLLDVPVLSQRKLGYPTGCEIVSVGMMIGYETETEVDIHSLVSEMPYSDDPNEGFRGDPATTAGFTIFPSALVDLVTAHIGSAIDMSGCTLDELKEKLNEDAPIVVWVSGLGFNVHVVCLTGYDTDGFFYNDPWSGRKDVKIKYDDFENIWDKAINDTKLGKSYTPRKAISYDPVH